MELKERCSLANPISIQGQSTSFPIQILAGNSAVINQNISFSSPLVAGKFSLKTWIDVSGDPDPKNDTIYREIQIVENQSLPYINDFESCKTKFYSDGEIFDWTKGNALKSSWTGAKSGQNTLITHRHSNGTGSVETVYFPPFIGFDTIYDAELRFWQNYDFGTNNGFGAVEFRSLGVWEPLTISGSNLGINWNTQFSSKRNSETFFGNSAGWIYSSYPLKRFNLRPSPLRLRFAAEYENSPGWAIDDLEIFVPEQNSASPLQIIFNTSLPPRQGLNPIQVKVSNTGHAPMDEFKLTFFLNGNSFSQQFSLSNPISMGQSSVVTITNALNLQNGLNSILVISSLPNNRKDDKHLDDTLSLSLNVLPVVSSFPSCQDFEQEPEFVNFDIHKGAIDSNWIYGLPSKTLLNSAYSGNYSWFTSTTNYGSLADQYLFTNEFLIDKNQCYEFSFWHQFDTEFNFDGATVEYTVDTGKTWLVLGSISDSNWYNTPHIQALDAFKAGWSGTSTGWESASKTIEFYASSLVQFRFRFSSNALRHFEGWAIDDVCFKEITGSCTFIGNEEEKENLSNLSLYPNPAKDQLKISYSAKGHGSAQLKVLNSLGQIVIHQTLTIHPKDNFDIDVSGLPKGIYLFQIDFDGSTDYSRIFEKL